MEAKAKKTGFARVKVKNQEFDNTPNPPTRGQYLKLAYPNGVSLILPVDISPELLGRYIQAID